MVSTFNVVAFQARIEKAAERTVKASVRSSEMCQRVSKRKERLAKSMQQAKKTMDDVLSEALVEKVGADIVMAECDQRKAEYNAVKLAAYTRQLERELVLKAQRAQQRADKATMGAVVWAIRTPDGKLTPVANTDGALGRIIGRSKIVSIAPDTLRFLLGDAAVDLWNDVGGQLVCNELAYDLTVPESGNVTLTKV